MVLDQVDASHPTHDGLIEIQKARPCDSLQRLGIGTAFRIQLPRHAGETAEERSDAAFDGARAAARPCCSSKTSLPFWP